MQIIQLSHAYRSVLLYPSIMLMFQQARVYVFLSARIILALEFTLIIPQESVRWSVIWVGSTMHRIQLASAWSIALEGSLLIIILNLVCRGAREDSLLIVALFLILLVMRMIGHVLISVLECSSRKIAHGSVCMVALRCNLLIAFSIAVFQTVMVSADNMLTTQQTAVSVYALPYLILLLTTPATPA